MNINISQSLLFKFTDINNLRNISKALWNPYIFETFMLYKLSSFNLQLIFNIIQINYISRYNSIGTLKYENMFKLKKKIIYKWNIKLSSSWYDAKPLKPFHSSRFAEYFNLIIYPNGIFDHDQGFALLQ